MHQKIWAFVLGLLSVASVLLLFFTGPENARPAEQPSPSPPPIQSQPSTPSEPFSSSPSVSPLQGYWLGVQEGKLAIWRAGEETPYEITEFYITHLPEADQKALKEGIYVTDDANLARLLEDYTG